MGLLCHWLHHDDTLKQDAYSCGKNKNRIRCLHIIVRRVVKVAPKGYTTTTITNKKYCYVIDFQRYFGLFWVGAGERLPAPAALPELYITES